MSRHPHERFGRGSAFKWNGVNPGDRGEEGPDGSAEARRRGSFSTDEGETPFVWEEAPKSEGRSGVSTQAKADANGTEAAKRRAAKGNSDHTEADWEGRDRGCRREDGA